MQKDFLYPVESKQYQVVFAISRLILNKMKFHLVLNLSEKCNYNRNLVWFNKIQKIFLCVHTYDQKQPINNCRRWCSVHLSGGKRSRAIRRRQWCRIGYKVFRLPKTLFMQGVCFYCTGALFVGAIPPTNSDPVHVQ